MEIVENLPLQTGELNTNEHSLGIGEDGHLYLIISETLIRKTQPDKYEVLLKNGQYFQQDDEEYSKLLLDKINYNGGNVIESGVKKIIYDRGFYFVKLD